MKVFFLLLFLSMSVPGDLIPSESVIQGQQPNMAVDTKGIIRMVYGNGEKIYCMTSSDKGLSFSAAVMVAELPEMHLGSTRGPQIASSKNFSMVSAISKDGTIHSYKLNHSGGGWKKSGNINDRKGSAVEGLMAITAGQDDNFYAAWLDIREGGSNNIYFSAVNAHTAKWKPNTLVYKSPDKHVCECCKPNIVLYNNKVVISFRNWIMGSRDIYYAVSANKGKSFSEPAKSGTGTWRLNACPMDGGGLAVDAKGKVSAAWRRNGEVYYWAENQTERKVASGRDVSMAQKGNSVYIAWQENNKVSVLNLNTNKSTAIGSGVSPKVYILDNGRAICLWEDKKVIRYKVI